MMVTASNETEIEEAIDMTEVKDFYGLSNESEGRIYQGSDDDPTSFEQRSRKDFSKWVSAHEEQVQRLICNSQEFGGERFCGEFSGGPFEEAFYWQGGFQ
jgi:hypothetical protein